MKNIKYIFFATAFILYVSSANAQLAVSGSETTANTNTVNSQQRPAIAMDDNGNYIIVWESLEQDGDGYGIYFQAYDNAGTPQGSETIVNTTTNNDQRMPDIAMDSDGDFVITWQSYSQDGDSWGVYYQRFNNARVAQGNETLVNTTTNGKQCSPKVTMDDAGNFAIVWESTGDIYAALYNADGTTAKTEFSINSTTTNQQIYPNIAMDSDGDFVIVWQSYAQDGNGFGIYGQRYNAAGTAQSTNFLVNTTTSGQQLCPNIAMNGSGDFVIVWTDNATDGNQEGIYAQRYDAAGTTQGSETLINTTTAGSQDNADIAMNDDGAYIIVWNSYAQDGGYMGVYHQSYTATGELIGSETKSNTTTNYFQQFPKVAVQGMNTATIIWQDGNQNESNTLDGSNYGVVFQRYDASALPVELLYFYAEKENENVRLDWQTATEINNSHFDVEWSTDGINFEKIGEVAGAGTTNDVQFYDFLHKNPVDGENYYRLRQVDFDGKFEYTDVILIEWNGKTVSQWSIYPNPAINYFTIEASENSTIQLFDISGRLIVEKQISNQDRIDVSALANGTYFVRIDGTVKKLIVHQ